MNMRAARLRLGFTQEYMAEMLGMTPEVYGRMERGRIFPRLERFMDICEKVGESPNQLLGYSAPEAPAAGAGLQDAWLTALHRFLPVTARLTQRQLVAVRRHMMNLNRLLTGFIEPGPEQGSERPEHDPTQ